MFLNQILVFYLELSKKYVQNYIYNFQIKKLIFLLIDLLKNYLVLTALKNIGRVIYVENLNLIKVELMIN